VSLTPVLLIKIAVPPVLVAAMSLAARRWGPTIGGLIMGLPWMTGPVLYFLALDKGMDFAVRACTGIELAVLAMGGFILTYALVSRVARWPLAITAAVVSFGVIAHVTSDLQIELWMAAGLGAATLIVTYLLLPKPTGAAVPGPLPWWDIPARMSATFVLVAVIMLSADRLGPQLSGIVASYPVILTVVGTFTHHQWGRDAVLRVLRGISLSLLGFVAFFAVVGYGLPLVGLPAAFALALLAGLCVSALLIAINRWASERGRMKHPAPSQS
jgi:hypothetical protein